MSGSLRLVLGAFVATTVCWLGTAAYCQRPLRSPGPTEQVLEQSAEADRYTFVVFYKVKDVATQNMVNTVKQHLAGKQPAVVTLLQVGNPQEKPLIDKLGVGRAAMPLCVAFAPNGAVTGLFRKLPSQDDVAKAFVTPTMTLCMKAMQDGKIVLVCVQDGPDTPTPIAVQDFQEDPQFKDRVATVTLDPTDPAEGEFLEQLQFDASNKEQIATVLLAPPGVLVGKYKATTAQSEIAAELHAAGKCCDDPNCKHHKAAPANTKSAAGARPPAVRRK